MSNQSITNKLITNLNQVSDISKNMLKGSNVICIDTSNRRIGIDTKNPKWSIDISGDGSYNGIKCHNLDICGTAEISNGIFYDLRSITISGNILDISHGYFKKIDLSLLDVSTIQCLDISVNKIERSDLIVSNTISGNFFQCFSGIILGDLDICGTLNSGNFVFPLTADFSNVYIDTKLNLRESSIIDFSGTVNFLNKSNPVNFIELSGIHINTFSISSDLLLINNKADFSSITVSGEASFNTIIVSGEASFNTISAESISIGGISLESFVEKTNNSQFTGYNQQLDLSLVKLKKICVHKQLKYISDNSYNESFIDKLIIFESLDFSTNPQSIGNQIPPTFTLPSLIPSKTNQKIGNTFLNLNNQNVIESVKIIKNISNNKPTFLTLKEASIKSIMVENSGNDFIDIDSYYECIRIRKNQKNNNNAEIFDDQFNENIDSSYINISTDITQNIIEINSNLTIKLNNDNQGGDVDALNYRFYILGKTKTGYNRILAENINSVIVFDNSYNYSSTSLNFLGNHKNRFIEGSTTEVEDLSYIFFGISYENLISNKILTISLESFTASIKTIN